MIQRRSTIGSLAFPKSHIVRFASAQKLQEATCRRNSQSHILRATNFGDIVTADHRVISEEGESRNNQRYAIVVQDWATRWNQSYACKTKASQETAKNLRKFVRTLRLMSEVTQLMLRGEIPVIHGTSEAQRIPSSSSRRRHAS